MNENDRNAINELRFHRLKQDALHTLEEKYKLIDEIIDNNDKKIRSVIEESTAAISSVKNLVLEFDGVTKEDLKGKNGRHGKDGKDGSDGVSITYLGEFKHNPDNPKYLSVYRNITDNAVYLFDENNNWRLLVKDGKDGKTPTSWPQGGGINLRDVVKLLTEEEIVDMLYATVVKISTDSGNIIEKRADGIYSTNNISYNVVTKTADYTASINDIVLCDTTSAFTVTLPDASLNSNKTIYVKKISSDANTLTVNTLGGNIDGDLNKTTTTQYLSLQFVSDGTNWFII